MTKPIIHFAHANGVPSKTYQKLFDLLSDEFEIIYLPVLSAHKGYAVDNHWKSLTKQVIYSIESQIKDKHLSKPTKVIGLGHSLGSLTTLLASYERPDLFSQVIIMDPPMIMGKMSFVFDMAKLLSTKKVDELTPAGKSKKRRDHWQNRQEAYDQLRKKSLFREFDEDCFNSYIEHGLIEHPNGGVTLTVPVDSEVEVFRTNPSRFWLPMKSPKVPVHQLSGTNSQFIKYGFPEILKRKTGIDYSMVTGSHMFPLENPIETVNKIKKQIIDANNR